MLPAGHAFKIDVITATEQVHRLHQHRSAHDLGGTNIIDVPIAKESPGA